MIYRKPPKDWNPKYTVVSCIVECNGKILLLKRAPNKYEGNKWGVVAGKVEQEEKDIDAIIRESKEEAGLSFTHKMLTSFRTYYVEHPWYKFSYHVYTSKMDKVPDIKIKDDENTEYKWVTPKDAITPTLVMDEHMIIEDYYGL